MANATVVSSGWPIHLTPGNRNDIRALTNANAAVESSGWSIHLTPGNRKDLRALTNGKCGSGELWVADTSLTWKQKRFKSAHKWQMQQ